MTTYQQMRRHRCTTCGTRFYSLGNPLVCGKCGPAAEAEIAQVIADHMPAPEPEVTEVTPEVTEVTPEVTEVTPEVTEVTAPEAPKTRRPRTKTTDEETS